MKKMKWLLMVVVLLLWGCMPSSQENPTVSSDTGFVAATPGNYDSADRALLVEKDTEAQTITFQNLELGKRYTLYYDGATTYADKYGQPLSLAQLSEGQMVYVTFMKDRKRCNSITLSEEAFVCEAVRNFQFSDSGSKLMFNGEEYSIDRNLLVLTPDGEGERMDINAVDELRIVGKDHVIYSIAVTRGHGYLRLTNSSFFVGGWIEIGESRIYAIEEDMLLAVPEGTYPVTVSGGGSAGTETVTIERNSEYELDASQWQEEVQYGTLVFTVEPDFARVYLDGEYIDLSREQELEYGIHQMIAIAEGYQSITRYIRVGSAMANLDVTMEPEQETVSENQTTSGNEAVSGNETTSSNSVSENSSAGTVTVTIPDTQEEEENDTQTAPVVTPSSNQAQQVIDSTGGYQVYIDAPAGVEVYLDGSYIGITPLSFPKREGSFVITLRRSGYQTRSYTISTDDREEDVNYSFSELLQI